MNKLTPKEMANRLVTNHYLIINNNTVNDTKQLHLKHGKIAVRHTQLTVQEIIATYGDGEFETKAYWDLVFSEIEGLKNYPYVKETV